MDIRVRTMQFSLGMKHLCIQSRLLALLVFFLTAPLALGFSISGKDLRTGLPAEIATNPNLKGMVIVFLSMKCPCSQGHEATLASLSKDFPEFQFVGIHSNSNEAEESASLHFHHSALPFPVIQDKNLEWADHFKALKTPHVFVVDSNGETLYRGGVDDSRSPSNAKKHYLLDALTALKQGQEPPEKETRSLGCMITRN